ncbi:MAG: 16S rRNA (adenine(1518)-N(6)/adenine(1519)-N(6))-dimethyltransferase RsmA [bacterium]|nr:16S rRNA (adenine(1518)-N(6)/adenine(1519)-N(6))-dimethyltransferase RsmA [bacterium]
MNNLLMEVKKILSSHKVRLHKRLGQNFLIDEEVIYKIIEAAEINSQDLILEVGSGIGILTEQLALHSNKVIAVEIDPQLVSILRERFENRRNVCIINGNILHIDLDEILGNCTQAKVVTNLPYYITTPIIMHLLKKRNRFKSLIIMVQKEVGERILASPKSKDYGVLSIGVQYASDQRLIAHVSRKSFFPPPSVDSMVIKLTVLQEPKVSVSNQDMFFRVVEVSFQKRRKMIRNSLTDLGIAKGVLIKLLSSLDIDSKRRPETLSIQEFACLSNSLTREVLEQECDVTMVGNGRRRSL